MAGFVESAGPVASPLCPPPMLNRRGLAALPSALGWGPHRGSARRAALGWKVLPLGSAAVLPHQRALIDHVGLGRSGAAELVGPV